MLSSLYLLLRFAGVGFHVEVVGAGRRRLGVPEPQARAGSLLEPETGTDHRPSEPETGTTRRTVTTLT
jgi:hypothetical protein